MQPCLTSNGVPHTPSHAALSPPTYVVPVTPGLVSQVSRHGLEMHKVVGGDKRLRKSKRPAPLRLRLLGIRVGADRTAVQEGACKLHVCERGA